MGLEEGTTLPRSRISSESDMFPEIRRRMRDVACARASQAIMRSNRESGTAEDIQYARRHRPRG
jgi:hypothetical protein